MTVSEAMAQTVRRLRAVGVPQPERDARRLVAHAMDLEAARLILHARAPFPAEAALEDLVARRIARQPVSQILGWREFWGRRFRVTPHVLDPRPETETLVEHALAEPFGNVLDLGTGSGCILLTLMAEMPAAAGTGTDISSSALDVARSNGEALALAPTLLLADWFDGISGTWDLIVSNPPYVAESELRDLAPELAWEPRIALSPGGDGLAAYRRIAARAVEHLAPRGRLLLEIGPTQAEAVRALLVAGGLEDVDVRHDVDDRPRVISARSPG